MYQTIESLRILKDELEEAGHPATSSLSWIIDEYHRLKDEVYRLKDREMNLPGIIVDGEASFISMAAKVNGYTREDR